MLDRIAILLLDGQASDSVCVSRIFELHIVLNLNGSISRFDSLRLLRDVPCGTFGGYLCRNEELCLFKFELRDTGNTKLYIRQV